MALPELASGGGFQTAQRTVCVRARLATAEAGAACNGNRAHGRVGPRPTGDAGAPRELPVSSPRAGGGADAQLFGASACNQHSSLRGAISPTHTCPHFPAFCFGPNERGCLGSYRALLHRLPPDHRAPGGSMALHQPAFPPKQPGGTCRGPPSSAPPPHRGGDSRAGGQICDFRSSPARFAS